MAFRSLFRRIAPRATRLTALRRRDGLISSACNDGERCYLSSVTDRTIQRENEKSGTEKKDRWLTLPPFTPAVDGSFLGKKLSGGKKEESELTEKSAPSITAIRWVGKCCPELPRSLVQKLFRLRKVRRELSDVQAEGQSRRVAAKDMMNSGERLILPVTVEKSATSEVKCSVCNEEKEFLHSIILYKDPAIIVVNKPPGMPVQGGVGIKSSLDELAAKYLRFDDRESPRLVHRLDRDCSGVLVLGRTQLSASTLHSILREKTFEASKDLALGRQIIKKTYKALVIGRPRHSEGLISVPLGKVIMDDGKSERVTLIDDVHSSLAQSAVTEYRLIGSDHGYSWLELSPITGRKHQLRVHCAEVLGTPMVGDYKYGWQAHRKWKQFSGFPLTQDLNEEHTKTGFDPFALNLGKGSISDKKLALHLHCEEMILPDICQAMKHFTSHSDFDVTDPKSIKLKAPLPLHMQKSWDLLKFSS